MNKFSIAFCLFLTSSIGFSQITIDQSVNFTDGVTGYLIGAGVSVSNINSIGNINQAAAFTVDTADGDNVFNFPLTDGLVLGTGNVALSAGPNNAASSSTSFNSNTNDADLDALTTGLVRDLAMVEFDFTPTGDTVQFNYIFASEEYPEDASAASTDVIGFFLSGPGISGPYTNGAINLAIIPNTTLPVSIQNVNNGVTNTGPCDNCAYYINNGNGTNLPFNTTNQYLQADGFTTMLTAFAEVQCGELYHIKIAICDVNDYNGNSWVFLQTGSFASNAPSIAFVEPDYSPLPANSVYEGCEGGYIHFERPPNIFGDLSIDIEIGGTATNGVDYELITTPLVIPDGIEFVDIPIVGIDDGLGDANETISLLFISEITCAASSELVMTIGEFAPLAVTDSDVSVYCDQNANLGVDITGGVGDYTVTWSTNQTGENIVITDPTAGPVTYTVSDGCDAVDDVSGSVNITLLNYPVISVNVGADQTIDCTQSASIIPIVSGGNGTYTTYQWYVNDVLDQTGPNFFESNPINSTVELVVTDGCGNTGSNEMTIVISGTPLSVNINPISGNCGDVVTVSAVVSGGVGTDFDYEWSIDGDVIGTNTTVDIELVLGDVVTLSVTDDCGAELIVTETVNISAETIVVSIGSNISIADCFAIINVDIESISGGTGNNSYEWTLSTEANPIGSSDNVDVNVNGNDGATLTLTVTDNCGSTGSSSVVIDITTAPLTISLPQSISVNCLEIFNLNPTVTGGSGGNIFEWEVNGNLVGSNEEYSSSVDANTTFDFTVTDGCNNQATDAITVNLNPSLLNVSVTASTTDVCPGDQVTLTATVTSPIGTASYDWSTGGSSNQTSVNPDETTTYSVDVEDDCAATDNATYTVTVYDTQSNPLNAPDNITLCLGVTSDDIVSGGITPYDIQWPGDLVSYSNQTLVGIGVGEDLITITDHCDAVQIINLDVNSCVTIIPNVFTPDGDSKNSFYHIEGLEGYPNSRLIVYNRWGNVVLDDADYENNWDGDENPEGTYFFILYRSDKTVYEGNITILR